jgi:DNA topoisomerase-1
MDNKPGKVLVVVESPKKAREIGKYLGENYIVRATQGHIMDLPQKQFGINVDKDFEAKYVIIPGKEDLVQSLISTAKTPAITSIVLASDRDREGESISFDIFNQLKSVGKPIKRALFLEITSKEVKKALQNLQDINQNIVQAQRGRRALDRIVGFMCSPYLSKKFNDKLSAGRVQSVALRAIVDREREIENFKPDTYFNIFGLFYKDNVKDVFEAKYNKKITTQEEADKVKNSIKKANEFVVKDVLSEQKIVEAPPPLETSMLQQLGSSKLKLSIERTMNAAQKLYEEGKISYMRTDSVRNSPESIEAARKYLQNNGFSVPKTPNIFQNSDAAQDAHEAIRPTNIEEIPSKLIAEEDEKKVYELIHTMFLASQAGPAVFDTISATISGSDGSEFIAEGRVQIEKGWTKVAEKFQNKTKDVVLPELIKDDILNLKDVKVEKKSTQPPSRYSEGTLVKELKKRGIGRPATYVSIISRISGRHYVEKSAKGFIPTELGKKVVDALCQFFLFMDYKYTATMEKKLDEIEAGKLTYVQMMNDFFKKFQEEFLKARGHEGTPTGFNCDICGSICVVRKSSFGFFSGCVKYPACKGGVFGVDIVDGKVYKKEQKISSKSDLKCPECDSIMNYRGDGKFGPFFSCSCYPQCKGKRKYIVDKLCPKCNHSLFITKFGDILKYACTNYPECKYQEMIPEDILEKIQWADPLKITPPTFSAKVEKIIKPSKASKASKEKK